MDKTFQIQPANKIIQTTRSGKAGRECFSTTEIQRKSISTSDLSNNLPGVTDISGSTLTSYLGSCLLDPSDNPIQRAIKSEIRSKLSVYRSGDLKRWGEKCLTNENTPSWEDIAMLMVGKRCRCFYCHSFYILCYKNVYDPLQWSVDRIDNSKPHIKENIVISCLGCNLRRRQRGHKDFYDIKNCVVLKDDS